MGNKKKVNMLLVDDQRAKLSVLEAMLAGLDAVLVGVESGEQALRALREREFAVVLMDVRMPAMSGFEAAALIRSDPQVRAVPIIFLAGGDDDSSAEQAYALGAADYLTEPLNPVILRAKLGVFIDLYRTRADIARHTHATHLAALKTRDERIRLILDSTRDYAFIGMDADGIVTEWEGGAENITGWWADSACGQPVAILFTPQDQAAGKPQEEMRLARETGRAEDRRWHVRRDGAGFYADGVMVPLLDDEDRLRGYAKIFRDATAERLAAEQLEQSEVQLGESLQRYQRAEAGLQRLAAVAAQSTDFIGISNPDANYIYLNPAGRRISGVAVDAPIGQYGIVDFFTAESRAFFERVVRPALDGPGAQWEGELWMRHFISGAVIPVYYKAFAVCDEQGKRIGLATITRDITAQKQAEDELRRIAADLSEADRRKSEFLATLAHELRNPLAPIRTGLDLLRASGHDEGARARVVGMMDRQLGHLIRLVNDLLDVARITRGKIELRCEPTDAAALAALAVETSAAALEAGRHALQVDVAPEPMPLDVDVTRIVQVLSNLLHNAAKYTPPGGRIVLSVRREGAEAVLAVADSGIGIAAEDLATVFDMFTQVGRSMERSQGGLGIGLSLVRRLVELHGGQVGAASAGRDQGSTFTVRLPLLLRAAGAARDLPAAAPPAQPGPAPASTALRILVVDDNADAAESLAALLAMLGHTTRVAFDGNAGLAEARTFLPQLAFLDIGMPGMNGHELARALRVDYPPQALMLVALTGWGAQGDIAQSREAGFDLHLTKPVDFGRLDEVFAAMAGRPV